MGMIGILGSGWMVFAAVRALRGEEEAGCFELILAGAIGRGGALAAVLAALAIECAFLYAVTAVVLLASGDASRRHDGRRVPARRGRQRGAGARVRRAGRARLPAGADPPRRPGGGERRPGGRPVPADRRRHRAWHRLAAVGDADRLGRAAAARDGRPPGGAAPLRRGGGSRRRGRARGRPRARRRLEPHQGARARALAMALLGSPTQAAVRSELPTLIGWLVATGLFALRLARSPAASRRRSARCRSIRTAGDRAPRPAIWRRCSPVRAGGRAHAASRVGGLRDEEPPGGSRRCSRCRSPGAPGSEGGWRSPRATTVGLSLAVGRAGVGGGGRHQRRRVLRRHARGRRQLHRRRPALPGARRAPLRVGAASQPGRGARAGGGLVPVGTRGGARRARRRGCSRSRRSIT